MNDKYYCEYCELEITGAVYDLNDEPACESCYQNAVSNAEYAYESYREAQVTGN